MCVCVCSRYLASNVADDLRSINKFFDPVQSDKILSHLAKGLGTPTMTHEIGQAHDYSVRQKLFQCLSYRQIFSHNGRAYSLTSSRTYASREELQKFYQLYFFSPIAGDAI